MANLLETIVVTSDSHLDDRAYGSHKEYPKESLEYFSEVTNVAERNHATIIIGLGDLTFSRFKTLEYRDAVDEELRKQNELTGNRRYELIGNHDLATNGMTELQYYIKKGVIKPAENLTIGNMHITMANWGRLEEIEPNISLEEGHTNILLAHDYLKFKDTNLPNFGKAIELDDYHKFYGLDFIICGHIHKQMIFQGMINDGHVAKKAIVHYPGCMARPAYTRKGMDTEGNIDVIRVYDDGTYSFDIEKIPLWSLERSFTLEAIEEKYEEKDLKENRVDITDIVRNLGSQERNIGNPEDVIMSMSDIDLKYREKAVKLLNES